MQAFEAIRPDHHAKYLLTSGSTGTPKVVINTHRMLTANQQQMAQVWPFLNRHRLNLLEWLPWSHTFGANHNFNMALAHGGAIHVDEGRPAPGLIEKTVKNLREVKPNFYFNVPRGFDMLLPFLEQDEATARDVFERLEGVFYAGAALPQSVWERLEGVARRVRERPVWFTSSWGATETSPAITSVHWRIDRAGCIGAPLPGIELKLVPNAGKLEMRVRGPTVFPGYRDAPELTAKAFDEDGYYLIGDAGKLVDDARPELRRELRRPRGRGLQADERHLGLGGHAAPARDQRIEPAGRRRGGHRPRPRGGRPAGVPVARRSGDVCRRENPAPARRPGGDGDRRRRLVADADARPAARGAAECRCR